MESENDRKIYVDYITNEFPIMYQRLIRYITNGRVPYSSLLGICRVMDKKVVVDILNFLDYEAEELPFVVHNLSKVQTMIKKFFFDFELIKCLFMYSQYGILNRRERNRIINSIKTLNERTTRELLLKHFESFKSAVLMNATEGEVGATYIIEELDKQLINVYKQLSIYDV